MTAGSLSETMAGGGVLHVLTDTDRRGGQVFGADLAEALAACGLEVTTMALAPGQFDGGLPVAVLGRTRLGVATLVALRAAMRKVDVVVAHGSSTLPACALASLGIDVPIIYRQISDSLFWANTPMKRWRVRHYLRRMARVVALWNGAASTLSENFGVPAAQIDVIPNGVPARRFSRPASESARQEARTKLGLDPSMATAVYVGALVPEKGVDLAVRAAGHLPDVQLLIVGDGPERAALEVLARSLDQGCIVFAGALDDPAAAYDAADAIVLASRGGDSMPAVLIEAGLCGVPAVATPIAAIADIVLDGRSGRLVPPDDVHALAAGIKEVLGARDVLGEAARRHCLERFEIGVVAKSWARVIAEVA